MHKKVLYFQTKFLAEKKGDSISIGGFASTGDVDRVKDKVLPTAFTETLPLFLKNPVMLLQHDDNKVIGQFTDGTIKSNGLEVKGEVMYDIDGCMQKILDGVLGAFSIGFITQAYQYEDELGHIIYDSSTGLMAGYEWDDLYSEDVVRVITKVDLVEVSIVSTPCNPYALFQVAKDFFVEETKSLKTMATQKKGAPNEHEEAPVVETTEVPAQTETNTTTVEVPAGETPAIVEETVVPETDTTVIENDTTVEEAKTEVVKGDEKPEETPINGITEEEAKTLITEAVNAVTKALTEAFEAKLKTLVTDEIETLKKSFEDQEKKHTKLEKEVLNIETVRPGRGATVKSSAPVAITDEMVLKSLSR